MTIVIGVTGKGNVEAVLQARIPAIHEEDGCELYALHVDDKQLVMVERWTTPEALKKHGTDSAGLRVFNQAIDGKLAEPAVVLRLQAIPAGDPVKGQLS